MELLVCVINEDEQVEHVLTGFLELGVTGATIIKSQGMGRHLTEGVPVFGGLQAIVSHSRPHNTTVFSIIESKETLEAALEMVQRVCGDLRDPATGIVFTVPVSRAIGIAPELDQDPA